FLLNWCPLSVVWERQAAQHGRRYSNGAVYVGGSEQMKKAMGIITAIDARYMVTVVALVAALALPKLSRHSRKLHAAKVPAGIVVVGHLRPRRKFPSSGPNRPAAIAARDHERAVLDALRRVLRVTRTAGADTIKRGGLTPAQVAALQALNCPESVSMNQVAERTMT